MSQPSELGQSRLHHPMNTLLGILPGLRPRPTILHEVGRAGLTATARLGTGVSLEHHGVGKVGVRSEPRPTRPGPFVVTAIPHLLRSTPSGPCRDRPTVRPARHRQDLDVGARSSGMDCSMRNQNAVVVHIAVPGRRIRTFRGPTLESRGAFSTWTTAKHVPVGTDPTARAPSCR